MVELLKYADQDPQEVLPNKFDWSRLLKGDKILSMTITCADAELLLTKKTHTDTETIVWTAGGIAGKTYLIDHTITTEDQQVFNRSVYLSFVDK